MITKRNKRDGWFRKKKYPHFDLPKSFEEALAIVTDPTRVQRHNFLPFIGYVDVKRRFRSEKSPDRSIPKKLRKKIISRKERPLKYCAHTDGYIHAFYAHSLQPLYEAHVCGAALSGSVLGYRSGIGTNIHMAHDAFCEIAARQTCCAIALDIKGFFDSIDHQILKDNLCTVLGEARLPSDWYAVYKSMTKFSWINIDDILQLLSIEKDRIPRPICDIKTFRNSVRPSRAIKTNAHKFGIPQGSPLSAVFSNVYMLNFDKIVMQFTNEHGASYRRYSDDILIICDNQETDRLISFVSEEITKLGTSISLSDDKTELSRFGMDGNTQVCDKPIESFA